MVVRDLDYRLPAETRRIVDEMQLRFRSTLEYDVEPVVFLEALCRLVLIIAERDLADGRATLHLDEPDVCESLVVVRVPWTAMRSISSSPKAWDIFAVNAAGFS